MNFLQVVILSVVATVVLADTQRHNYGQRSESRQDSQRAPTPQQGYAAPAPQQSYAPVESQPRASAPAQRVYLPPTAPPQTQPPAPVNSYAPPPVTSPPQLLSQASNPAHEKEAEPEPYEFQYAVKDEESGNDYSRNEKSDGHTVTGSYRVLLPDGRTQIVTYIATHDGGYSADVTYEGVAVYPDEPAGGYGNYQ